MCTSPKVDVFKKKNVHSTEEFDALINVFEKQKQRLSELVFTLLDMTNMNDGFENETICLKDVLEELIAQLEKEGKLTKVAKVTESSSKQRIERSWNFLKSEFLLMGAFEPALLFTRKEDRFSYRSSLFR